MSPPVPFTTVEPGEPAKVRGERTQQHRRRCVLHPREHRQRIGAATLSWTPPTENADMTALTDLDGYKIYYGLTVGDYPNSITLPTPGISMGMVENLSPGTWFFVVTAFDTSNNESEFSNVAGKTIAP